MNSLCPVLFARLPTLALELPARTMAGSSLREAQTAQSRQIYQSELNAVNELRNFQLKILMFDQTGNFFKKLVYKKFPPIHF